MKICSNCQREWPATPEFFARSKACRGGITGTCRECRRAYIRDWKRANKERVSPRRRQLYADKNAPIQAAKRRALLDRAPVMARANVMRQGMIGRATKLGLPFDREHLTTEWLRAQMDATPTCPCCRLPFDFSFKHDGQKSDRSPSIDRLRPLEGYTVANVALICWRCNNLKRDATVSELEGIVAWMRSVGLS